MTDHTPETIVRILRQPAEPAHGVWELWRRVLDAAAVLIEQQEQIIAQNNEIIELFKPKK